MRVCVCVCVCEDDSSWVTFLSFEHRLFILDFVSQLYLQSCKTKSRTESLGSRLILLCSGEKEGWERGERERGKEEGNVCSITDSLIFLFLSTLHGITSRTIHMWREAGRRWGGRGEEAGGRGEGGGREGEGGGREAGGRGEGGRREGGRRQEGGGRKAGGREGGRREGGRKEGGRQEGGREAGGRAGWREGGREAGGREDVTINSSAYFIQLVHVCISLVPRPCDRREMARE